MATGAPAGRRDAGDDAQHDSASESARDDPGDAAGAKERRRALTPSAFGRLSTGIKMLIILSAALLPLGLIALFASIESAQTNQLTREAEARLMASDSARVLNGAISGGALSLREALAGFGARAPDAAACRRALDTLATGQRFTADFILFDGARRVCATDGFSRAPVRAPAPELGTEVRLVPSARTLRFGVTRGRLAAIGEFPYPALVAASRPRNASTGYSLSLWQGDAGIDLGGGARQPRLRRHFPVLTPVAGGQLALKMLVSTTPIGALEVLLVLLPILMWLAAALIGWLVVDRLLVRPLAQMERLVTAHRGRGPLILPPLTTPAHELRLLGDAFRGVTQRLAEHEAELEQGLARQTRLTREVHHRVKNNLQVVSSLINLHARGAKSPEAAEAYASIQRRVDALAVVHRNHYAEMEENHGVALRALIGELAANLRGTASPQAARMSITLELMPAAASQDVAVPVAFLITELVEHAMRTEPGAGIAIQLRPGERATVAELTIAGPGLMREAEDDAGAAARFRRVLEGLSRQLRAPLVRDEALGSYAICVAILPVPAEA